MIIIGLTANNRIGSPGGVLGRYKRGGNPTAPVFTSNPSITGSDAVGSVLTVNFSATGNPIPTATYQWTNAGVDIGGATSTTYTSTTAGQTLRCRVTLNNGVGGPVVMTSNLITVTSADYIITNDAEWTALMANSAATLSGKTAEIRGALGDTTITGKAFTTPFVVRGGVGGSVRRMNFNGTITNVTFRGLMHQMTGWPKTHDSTVMFNTCNLSGMRWESCTFRHGYGAGLVNLDPTANYPEYIRVDNVQTATTSSTRYALTFQDPAATSAWIEFFNRGAANVYYKIGDNTVVATTSDTLATTGTGSTRSASFNPQTSTHIAILAASGSQQINARTEIGMAHYLADAFNSSGAASSTDMYFRDCEVMDMANGFKKITPATSGAGVLMDCRTRRVYMDQSAFVVDPGATLYVLRNSFGIPFARSGIAEANNGDARDPHGDIAQHFGPGIGTLGPLYYGGNRHYMENKRTGVDSQGLFVNSNNFTPSYNRVFSISDIFLGGAANGITVGDTNYPAEATMIYGATVVDPRDITTQTRLRFEDGKNNQIYIGKSLAVGVVGNPLFDQSLDLTGISTPATVFTDLTAAQTATTRASLEAALTTVGPASGIGAVATANAIDWTAADHTQVILWQNVPSGAEWLDLPLQAINTMITLPLRLILNRRASQTVVPGTGVEWRSVASDGTTQIQAWTTTSGTIQPDQYIQIRKMSSASGLTAVDFAVTINGFTQICSVTTLAAAPTIFHTQSGTGPYFRDPANSTPASTTRMEFRANIYPTSLPGTAVRLFTQESNSCDLELTTTGGFRLYVRDGAATSVLSGVGATTGYSLNAWQTIVVDVNHSAGTASITNNGTVAGFWTWTPTASPTFPTIREIAFCGTTAGNNLVPSGWQIEYVECYFTTAGTRSPRKNVSGNAATVNADPWRQGDPATSPSLGVAGLVFTTGNSHMDGRDSASGEAFAANVYEYNQAGSLVQPTGAILDTGDSSGNHQAGDISPMVSFANALSAARPDLARIVFVGNAQGSTGFVDGTWSGNPANHPNRLTTAVSRWNAAKTALEAQGYTVQPIAAVHISSNPDASTVVATDANVTANALIYQNSQAEYVDYLRANLNGVGATFPVIVSNGMLSVDANVGTNTQAGVSAGQGIPFIRPYTWFMDPINDWNDGETGNLPVADFDGLHANRVGEATKGRLTYAALARANNNTQASAPFSSLSSWSNMESLYDFRSGTGKDTVGAYNLTQGGGSQPGLIRWSSSFGTRVFDRPSGTNRVFFRNRYLPSQYTISARVRFDSLSAAQGLFMNTTGSGSVQQRFFINATNFVAGNAGQTDITTAHGMSINTTYNLAVTYDGTNIRAYKDGVLLGSAVASVTPDQTRGLYIGCQNDVFAGPLLGDMQWAAIYNTALSASQLVDLTSATYNRP